MTSYFFLAVDIVPIVVGVVCGVVVVAIIVAVVLLWRKKKCCNCCAKDSKGEKIFSFKLHRIDSIFCVLIS